MRLRFSVGACYRHQRTIADLSVKVGPVGVTSFDGARSGHTDLTFTPGIRFNPTGRQEKAWWVQAGIEFPVADTAVSHTWGGWGL